MHGPINVKSFNNISEWQMGFNSAFKGLITRETQRIVCYQVQLVVKSHVVFLRHPYADTCILCSHTWHAIHISHWWFRRISL